MREIKFRAWDFEKNEMIPGDDLAFEHYAPLVDLLSREGIMQYTGMKDKNGQEIYEGDLIRSRKMIRPNVFEVIYGRCSFEFIRETGTRYRADQLLWSDIEIIGHIYQTGESRKLDILYDDMTKKYPGLPF